MKSKVRWFYTFLSLTLPFTSHAVKPKAQRSAVLTQGQSKCIAGFDNLGKQKRDWDQSIKLLNDRKAPLDECLKKAKNMREDASSLPIECGQYSYKDLPPRSIDFGRYVGKTNAGEFADVYQKQNLKMSEVFMQMRTKALGHAEEQCGRVGNNSNPKPHELAPNNGVAHGRSPKVEGSAITNSSDASGAAAR